MKNLFLLFIAIVFTSSLTFGQDCPEPVKKKYVKVTSIDFAKEYEDCPVIIEAEFFRVGYLPGFKKPNKLRKMFYFQCVEKGEEGRPKGLTKVISGEFFVIEKEKADLIFDLKKGDNI